MLLLTMHTPIHISSPVIISVGGALIAPKKGVDVSFLTQFNTLIRSYVDKGMRFMLVAGGGAVCREYRDAGKAVIKTMPDDDLDWIGIHATRLNGHLLRTIFKDIAHHRMIENYHHPLENWHEPIAIGAGWKPGFSSDYCATYLAKEHGAKYLINLSNIDYVFDKDPARFPEAKPLKDTTWAHVLDITGTTWSPGMSAPFDPIACQLAREIGLTVIVANGSPLENLSHILSNVSFKGTVIHP